MDSEHGQLIRGLTVAEYHRLRNRIVAGEMTWAEAEAAGLCHPATPSRKPLGRPRAKETGRVASVATTAKGPAKGKRGKS